MYSIAAARIKGHVNPKIQVYPLICKKSILKTILLSFFCQFDAPKAKTQLFYGRLTSG